VTQRFATNFYSPNAVFRVQYAPKSFSFFGWAFALDPAGSTGDGDSPFPFSLSAFGVSMSGPVFKYYHLAILQLRTSTVTVPACV